jgi:NADPH:quinone reductase-like Zn-dependent oxidoreductase
MARTMTAALFRENGPPDVLQIERVPVPEPGPGSVRLRVEAAALNHLDLWVRRGLPIETTMPHIGGSDVAGRIDAVGPGVAVDEAARYVVDPSLGCGTCEWCRRGDTPLCITYRILGEHTDGGFAEFVVVPAANLYAVPDALPLEQAAAAPIATLTAWRALVTRARLQAGESVLVTGASGGVATAAIQIARYLGARVYAVTSADSVERVRGLGADVVYDRDSTDFSRALWHDTDRRGVDVVLDSVGAAFFESSVRSLARGGRMVVYGATTGHAATLDLRVVFWKQIEILGSTMATPSEFRAAMDLVVEGRIQPVVDSVLPLERVREAHERLEAGQVFGKIVLVP